MASMIAPPSPTLGGRLMNASAFTFERSSGSNHPFRRMVRYTIVAQGGSTDGSFGGCGVTVNEPRQSISKYSSRYVLVPQGIASGRRLVYVNRLLSRSWTNQFNLAVARSPRHANAP